MNRKFALGNWLLGRLTLTCLAGLGLSATGLVGSSRSTAAIVEYSAGHADIGLAYENGELELHWHFGANAVLDGAVIGGTGAEFAPNEAYARVLDSAMSTAPVNLPFLGIVTGDPVWILPQGEIGGLPFLGIATEELDPEIGPSLFSGVTLNMTDFSGPGQFALYQTNQFGVPVVYFDTLNGIGPEDTLSLGIGTHDHFNWGFTQEGVYDVTLTATANRIGGGFETDTGTFKFVVGTFTAVPEPSSAALLCLGATVTMCGVRRRRK